MSTEISILIIILFAVGSAVIGIMSRLRNRGESLLVANRNLGVKMMALSIAATWIWAPALFISAEKAYTQGIAGLFWFTVPNVACLIIFGWFMSKFIHRIPEGFTLTAWMREHKSKRVQTLYLIQTLGLTVCSIAVQLLAGAMVISTLTGLSYLLVCAILAGVTLVYSMIGGIRASVHTDAVQMGLLLGLGIPIIFAAVHSAGWDAIPAGFGGASGLFSSPLNLLVITTFGIPTTIGLLAGPFGDQTFYQRAFSQKPQNILKTFVAGALIFAIVPLTFALLGFAAAGRGIEVANTGMVNVIAVLHFLPSWVIYPFIVVLLAGLITTIDSKYLAAGSFIGYDLQGSVERTKWVRLGMLIAAVIGFTIALAPGMKVLYLFLFYGMLRATTFLPTVLTFFRKTSERGMFYGVLAAMLIGLPVFAYANFNKIPWMIIFGSLLTIGLSGLISTLLRDREIR